MKVHAIDHNQVQVLCPHCDPILQFFVVEKQWFATDDNQLLGVVLYQRATNDWAYVIFGPNASGCYRWIAGSWNVASQIQAAQQVQAEMERIAETGQEVFHRPLQRLLHNIRTAATRRRARRATRRAIRSATGGGFRWPATS